MCFERLVLMIIFYLFYLQEPRTQKLIHRILRCSEEQLADCLASITEWNYSKVASFFFFFFFHFFHFLHFLGSCMIVHDFF
jgi:hypothetical protein